jgi:aldose sugar dehydrogenase
MQFSSPLSVTGFLLIFALLSSTIPSVIQVNAQEEFRQREFVENGDPELADSNLKIEQVVEGLDTPTTMAFLGPNDFLVLEKDKGTVQRVTDGKMFDVPVLDAKVANSVERCMCGIAISKQESTTYVFLYFTEIDGEDGEDRKGKAPIGNRLYRYEFVDNRLINPTLLVDLPATPGPRHNGGVVVIGPDENLYVTVGDIDGSFRGQDSETVAQNYDTGKEPDGRSGILRITQNGLPVGKGILGDELPLSLYYAYGIRNSFGIAFDPVSGKLWDTENGPGNSDEINLVEPGFNSGWQEVMGLAEDEEGFDASGLVDFDGNGHYRDPELVWLHTVGPTAILFMTSSKLGPQYVNEMFVADVHDARIYHFALNEDRTGLDLPAPLVNKIIRNPNSDGVDELVFGEDFGGISDLKLGPDGYLYVVSVGLGKVFRIVPN